MAAGKFVAYYRVSTKRQGASGLGLDAQREAVAQYLNGGQWKLVAEFTEVESGKNNDRPKLAGALQACKLYGATLIIAKLDRLARNLNFISNLMEAGVEFTAVDFPQANRLTVHILASVAEHEREMISQRTKAALAAAKRRGVKLGNPNLQPGIDTTKATATKIANAVEFARRLLPVMKEIGGSLRIIAAGLNERGIGTRRGGQWTAAQVMRIMRRATVRSIVADHSGRGACCGVSAAVIAPTSGSAPRAPLRFAHFASLSALRTLASISRDSVSAQRRRGKGGCRRH
jgi:DNA invertase Pin-like site-specific DNA recombinase